jgi:hypothetical protein
MSLHPSHITFHMYVITKCYCPFRKCWCS